MIYGAFDLSNKKIVFTSLHSNSVEEFMKKTKEKKKQNLVSFQCSGKKLTIIFPKAKYFEELQTKLIERGILECDKQHHICPVMRKNKFTKMDLGNKRVKITCNHKCRLKKNCLILAFNK